MWDWQIYITVVVIVGAVGYALWRIYDNIRDGGDPCRDCEMKKNCQKNNQKACHCK